MLNVSSYTLTDPGAPRNLKPTPMIHISQFKLSKSGKTLWYTYVPMDDNGYVDVDKTQLITLDYVGKNKELWDKAQEEA